MKPRHPRSALSRLTLSLLAAASLQAQAASLDLNLPAQPLAASLTSLAQAGQLQILFDEAQLRGLRAPAVDGRYEPEAALQLLLRGSNLDLVPVDHGFVIRPRPQTSSSDNGITLQTLTVVGDGLEVNSANIGRSTLGRREIERQQANNIPSLLQTLPGVTMGGSAKPGGQTVNIWGLGDAEDVPFTLDGASKSGFERYQQGTIFIEPELIERVEVEKGPYSAFTGNGGFGGTVHMETRDATDMLKPGRNSGAFVKYGYQSNDQQRSYTGALFGRTDDGLFDGLLYLNHRDSNDIKLAGHIDQGEGYLYPERYPYTAQNQDAVLFKGNFNPSPEHSFGLTYSRSKLDLRTPFSAVTFLVPSKWSIDRYGSLEAAMHRLLSNRELIDTTWSGKYHYQPQDNPLVDLEISYSLSDTDQTDTRDDDASYSSSTGGKYINTQYRDKVFEVRNTSLFDSGALAHELTAGIQWRLHTRDVLMYLPTFDSNPDYNFGWYQPQFMPAGEQEARSLFLQDAITLGDVTITPSLRYDHVTNRGKRNLAVRYNNPDMNHDYRSVTYTGWSPRLSVFWRVNPNLGLFVDYAKTWRAPVLDEQFEVQSSSTLSGSSRDLDAEQMRGVRGGAVVSLPDLISQGDNLQVRATLFRHRISDEIFKFRSIACQAQSENGGSISNNCGDLLPLSNYRNLDGLTIRGAEIESYYDSQRVFASLSYSWTEGRHDGAYSNPWGPNVWARDIPPAKWVAMFGVKVPEIDVQLGWQGEFVRKSDRQPSDRYDGSGERYWDSFDNGSYDVHRVFADWSPRTGQLADLSVKLTVDNIFNRFYRPAMSGDNAYSQGRNAKFSVSYAF